MMEMLHSFRAGMQGGIFSPLCSLSLSWTSLLVIYKYKRPMFVNVQLNIQSKFTFLVIQVKFLVDLQPNMCYYTTVDHFQ